MNYAATPYCVEIWIKGVPVPLTLQFREREAANNAWQELADALEPIILKDDQGQEICFQLRKLLAIRLYEAQQIQAQHK